MKWVSAKFVPKLLAIETCAAVARILLQCAVQDAHFMKTVITNDESWVYGCDLETKAEACQVWSKVKVMLTVFFDHEGVILHEYAPDGQAVNKEYYVKVLHGL
jgi:hypothetical protein